MNSNSYIILADFAIEKSNASIFCRVQSIFIYKAECLGRVDISDYVILSDQRERRISYFALNLSSLPEIPRRCAPRNDIFGQMSTEPTLIRGGTLRVFYGVSPIS